MDLVPLSNGTVTGYGFVFGLQREFSANEHLFNDMESIGVIDAPDLIAAGAVRKGKAYGCPVQVSIFRS